MHVKTKALLQALGIFSFLSFLYGLYSECYWIHIKLLRSFILCFQLLYVWFLLMKV